MEKFIIGAALGGLAGALLTANNYKMRLLVKKGQEEAQAKLDKIIDEQMEKLEGEDEEEPSKKQAKKSAMKKSEDTTK